MGRPLHKKYCGTGPGNQIKVRAKIGTNPEGYGHIVKQVSGRLYLVEVNGNKGRCKLVDKDNGVLEAGDMTISVKAFDGSIKRMVRLKARTGLLNNGLTSAWSFAPAVAGYVEMEEVDTDSFIPEPVNEEPEVTPTEPDAGE